MKHLHLEMVTVKYDEKGGYKNPPVITTSLVVVNPDHVEYFHRYDFPDGSEGTQLHFASGDKFAVREKREYVESLMKESK